VFGSVILGIQEWAVFGIVIPGIQVNVCRRCRKGIMLICFSFREGKKGKIPLTKESFTD
jgi:hypothetical protein